MYDFNIAPSRIGTGSYKWDEHPGSIPLWVADMDFQTAPCIIDALRRRVDHGVFGYTLVRPEYYDALIDWNTTRHSYRFDREQVIYTSGVVPALSAIIKALTKPDDGVIVMTPVYNCFFSSIRNNGCRVVECPLIAEPLSEHEFSYRIDLHLLERLAAYRSNTMLLLCNPHNPGGRVWTDEELRIVSAVCHRYGVQVVSDEIHCELTMPGYTYTPYGTIDKDAVVCLAPSKAFNTAGLQIANIITPSPEIRARIDRAININEVCDVNPFGVEGLIAAYSPEGAEWLEELKAYLAANRDFTRDFLIEHLPQCPMSRLEATYLPWIDITRLGKSGSELAEIIEREAHVRVNEGAMYGDDRYIRLNIASPRPLLAEALYRIINTLK